MEILVYCCRSRSPLCLPALCAVLWLSGKRPLPEPSMMMRILLLLFCAVALSAHAEDWPTWRYDVERTAESPQLLADDLSLLWSRELPRPLPAFNDVRLQFGRPEDCLLT